MQTPEEIYLYPPNSHKTLLSVHGTAPDLFLQQPRDELMIYLVYRLSLPFFLFMFSQQEISSVIQDLKRVERQLLGMDVMLFFSF